MAARRAAAAPPLLEPQPYEFEDDPSLSDEQLLGGIVPLPDCPIVAVMNGLDLVRLHERMSFRAAFAGWASAVLGVFEYDSEAASLDRVMGEIRVDLATDRPLTELEGRYVLFKQLVASGLTLRQMSARLEIPLYLVVRYAWHPRAERQCDAIADMEDYLIAHGLDKPVNQISVQFGLHHGVVRKFCDRHHIPVYDARFSIRREVA